MEKLTLEQKEVIKRAARMLFDDLETFIGESITIISALDALEIDTTEMKSDFEFEFKQPYKN